MIIRKLYDSQLHSNPLGHPSHSSLFLFKWHEAKKVGYGKQRSIKHNGLSIHPFFFNWPAAKTYFYLPILIGGAFPAPYFSVSRQAARLSSVPIPSKQHNHWRHYSKKLIIWKIKTPNFDNIS